MSFKTRCVQTANRHLKGLGVLLTGSTLLLGSLVGVTELRAQGPSEAETIEFIEQMTKDAAKFTSVRSTGMDKGIDSKHGFIFFRGKNIRFAWGLMWVRPGKKSIDFQERGVAYFGDLAEVRIQGNKNDFLLP